MSEAKRFCGVCDLEGVHGAYDQCFAALRAEWDALRSERDFLKQQCHTLQDAVTEQKTPPQELLLRRLLNKVNKVTSVWRHQRGIYFEDMDELSNRQIEVEKDLAAFLSADTAPLASPPSPETGEGKEGKENGK